MTSVCWIPMNVFVQKKTKLIIQEMTITLYVLWGWTGWYISLVICKISISNQISFLGIYYLVRNCFLIRGHLRMLKKILKLALPYLLFTFQTNFSGGTMGWPITLWILFSGKKQIESNLLLRRNFFFQLRRSWWHKITEIFLAVAKLFWL